MSGLWHRNDDGYSLVEMLVVIIMFTLVTGAITTVVITTLKHQNELSTRGSVLAATRNSLENMDRDIRSADPLCFASTTEITMYEPSSGDIVDYQYDAATKSIIYRKYVAATLSGPPALCTGSDSVSGTATPTYYNESGSPIQKKTVLASLTSSSVFTAQAVGTAFDSCPTGVDPSTLLPVNIATLTASVSVQPVSLKKPVSTTDCGTYLRNFVVTVS